MIKDVIVALLTTTINRYQSIDKSMLYKPEVLNSLNIILDYVEDIPEDNSKPTTVVLCGSENEKLEKRIHELEESCENMCEVEKNLHNKVQTLRSDNTTWRNACNELREKNEILEERLSVKKIIEEVR